MRLLQLDSNGQYGLTADLPSKDIPPYAILSHIWSKVGDDCDWTYNEVREIQEKWADSGSVLPHLSQKIEDISLTENYGILVDVRVVKVSDCCNRIYDD